MKTTTLEYRDGDTLCKGFLANPDAGGALPGILVVHEAPGLDEHAKRRSQMLAELGYVAFGVDMYGDGKVAANTDEAMALLAPIRDNQVLLRGRASAPRSTSSPRSPRSIVESHRGDRVLLWRHGRAGTGACSGAATVATVAFHGMLTTKTPDDSRNIKGKVLACTGADDPIVPAEQVQAFQMRK